MSTEVRAIIDAYRTSCCHSPVDDGEIEILGSQPFMTLVCRECQEKVEMICLGEDSSLGRNS